MRALEYSHGLRMLPAPWPVPRVDGKGFSKFTEARFEEPLDERFSRLMVQTAEALLVRLGAVYAYAESSVLFPRDWELYDRDVEKAVSISAGIAGSMLTPAGGEAAVFDSRVWLGASDQLLVYYFCWRQADAARCALDGWAYWRLRKAGERVAAATRALREKSASEKNELLYQRGINFNDTPPWQRRAGGLYWQQSENVGFDPVRKVGVAASRGRVMVDRELPMRDEYGTLVSRPLGAGGLAPT